MFEIIAVILLGVLCIVASILDWNWWFESRKVRFLTMIFGRKGTRILYGVFGLMFIGTGVYLTIS
ncbi:MAG: immunity 17 family protein [Clostridiales bacterium]|nr:immunity 17 family protein [Clostridiales bacterium]